MSDVFRMDLRDYINFKKMIKNNPKLFGRAAGNVINSFAFGVRKIAIRNIRADGIVRNQRFVNSSVIVRRARITQPIYAQKSEVGSIARKNFTGWEEQETGKATERKHHAVKAARKNNFRRKILMSVRMNKRKTFPQPKDFKGKSAIARSYKMLHVLSRSGFTKPFIIVGIGSKIQSGVYKFGTGTYPKRKLIQLQDFHKPKQTKKTLWLTRARKKYLRHVNMRTLWGRAVTRELKKIYR